MKLSTITGGKENKPAHFDHVWEGNEFWFEAHERALTPRVMQQLKDMETRPIEMANGMAGILTDWSIYRDEEGDFPPTAENLAILPIEFLTDILDKMSETWAGNEQKPKQSASSSGVSAN